MISRKLYEKPNSIEELAEQRDWMKQIPDQLKAHEVKETFLHLNRFLAERLKPLPRFMSSLHIYLIDHDDSCSRALVSNVCLMHFLLSVSPNAAIR